MSPMKMKSLRRIMNLISFMKKGIIVQIWSIKVFNSADIISKSLFEINMDTPSLQASDVNDVQAEFVADPFIVKHDSKFYLFFEILNKTLQRGQIGLAMSVNGVKWDYQQVVLREDFHLSYPQVFIIGDDIFMLPETSGANCVLLYKAKRFPFNWEVSHELFKGNFLDPSIVRYEDKWWVFAGAESGNLHLFYSTHLEGPWIEHLQSPIISSNMQISRPGGRIIYSDGMLYRYTQADYPHYGDSVRVFRVKKLTELEYEEEEISQVLCGTNKDGDWRKDGMHHIDQLKISENQWLIAVDGHRSMKLNYFVWKLDRIRAKIFS